MTTVVVAGDDLVIRRMKDDEGDYGLIADWRNLPHVRRWWDPDHPDDTLQSVKEEFGPDTIPGAPSTACIIELRGQPIGFIQFYRWASYADEALEVGVPFDDMTYSLDVFIGDPDCVGIGIGTKAVRMLSDHLIDQVGASSVSLATDRENVTAQRCYEKAGFKKVKEILDTDTYQGERITSWLMVKDR